jgi:hypothetical protein
MTGDNGWTAAVAAASTALAAGLAEEVVGPGCYSSAQWHSLEASVDVESVVADGTLPGHMADGLHNLVYCYKPAGGMCWWLGLWSMPAQIAGGCRLVLLLRWVAPLAGLVDTGAGIQRAPDWYCQKALVLAEMPGEYQSCRVRLQFGCHIFVNRMDSSVIAAVVVRCWHYPGTRHHRRYQNWIVSASPCLPQGPGLQDLYTGPVGHARICVVHSDEKTC